MRCFTLVEKDPAINAVAIMGRPIHFELVAKLGHCLYAGNSNKPMVYMTPLSRGQSCPKKGGLGVTVAVVPMIATPLESDDIGSWVL